MAPRAKKVIRLKVQSITTGPSQYKPFEVILEPYDPVKFRDLYIEVPIPKEHTSIVKAESGPDENIMLTKEGFKILLKEVGHIIYEAHEEFTEEARKSKVKSTNVSKKK